jgi:UMF1 family MFS transporter
LITGVYFVAGLVVLRGIRADRGRRAAHRFTLQTAHA